MSDETALLAAILAHPDEDTPRLMFADWLQENGQPERAEFIRIQCAPDADEAAETRAEELEVQHRAKWLAGMPQFVGVWWQFRRGFPECLDCPGDLLLERYEAFARVGSLRSLWLYALSPWDLRDLSSRPWEPQWIELSLTMAGGFPSHAFVAFANCPQLAQLRRLRLVLSDLDADGVRAIALLWPLQNLQQFHLLSEPDDPRLAPLRERFGNRLVIG